jgi:hypothetical protein
VASHGRFTLVAHSPGRDSFESCPRERLRHNNVKRLDDQHSAGQRLRTDRTSCSVARGEIRPESETGNYTGRAFLLSSGVAVFHAAPARHLEEVLDEIKQSGDDATNNQQQQNRETGHGEFELPIAVLVGRRQ